VFQNYALFPHLTVAENVAFGLKRSTARGGDRRGWRRCWRWCGSTAGATAARRSFRAASSSAWRWRGRWPRAAVLLLDEPLSALDLKLRRRCGAS
jgi:spermidine/putrescine transport system ATP-binding protein